jgi:hypothetical protein
VALGLVMEVGKIDALLMWEWRVVVETGVALKETTVLLFSYCIKVKHNNCLQLLD